MFDGSVQHQIEKRFSRRLQANMVVEGLIVGIVAGATITLYRLALSYAEKSLRQFLDSAAHDISMLFVWVLLLAAMLLLVILLVSWEPDAAGSGIPQTQAEIMGRAQQKWWRVILAKFSAGTITALAGLSLGREGPSVQLGAMAGKGVAKGLRRDANEERICISCGAASGMAAAFHAPLTGVMFALEEMHRSFNAALIIAVMCSCVASDFLVSQILGMSPVLDLPLDGHIPLTNYLLVIILGLLAGLFAAFHNVGMFFVKSIFDRFGEKRRAFKYAVAFAVSGVVALIYPQLLCGGDAIVELLEHSHSFPLTMMLLLLLGKYLFTALCFGSGAPGGTLFPQVIMGALLGGAFGGVVIRLGFVESSLIMNFIVLGIAGSFSGIIRAPVTAIVLAFELTGSLETLLSVSVVSIVAYVSANMLKIAPFYEELLAQMLQRIGELQKNEGDGEKKIMRSYVVEAGSFADGKAVRELDWPEGSLILTISRVGSDIIPTGDTELRALDNLLVMMDKNNEETLDEELRSRVVRKL